MTLQGQASSVSFTADCVRRANQVVLRVSGRLIDPRAVTPNWGACLQQLSTSDVRVDLGGVTDIDARGLGMIAELLRETHKAGGRLAVVNANPRVRRLLAVTHLDALLEDEPRRAA